MTDMTFGGIEALSPQEMLLHLSTVYFPAELEITKGKDWIHVTTDLPVTKEAQNNVELYMSRNDDERFYCMGLFVLGIAWLHVHFTFDDNPRMYFLTKNIPISGGLK